MRGGNNLEWAMRSMRSRQGSPPSCAHLVLARARWQPVRRILACSAALLVWLATTAQRSPAQARPDFLTANIDSTASPRDDFFQYANGAWFKRNPIPDDVEGAWGVWKVVADDLDVRLRRISEDAAAKRTPRGSAEQLIGDFWFTAMDSV